MKNLLIRSIVIILCFTSSIALAKKDLCMGFTNNSKTSVEVSKIGGTCIIYTVRPGERVIFDKPTMLCMCDFSTTSLCSIEVRSGSHSSVLKRLPRGTQIHYRGPDEFVTYDLQVPCSSSRKKQ